MAPSEQLHAYLHWLKARGIRYPRLVRAGAPAETGDAAVAPATRVVFLGDAPLTGDERTLLDKMIAAMHLNVQDVLITTVAESAANGLAALPARLVIILGAATAKALLPAGPAFDDGRGRLTAAGAPGSQALITYHPRDLLRLPAAKRAAWADLQVAMAALGLDGAK